MIYDQSGTKYLLVVDGNDPESMVVNHRVTNFTQFCVRSIRSAVVNGSIGNWPDTIRDKILYEQWCNLCKDNELFCKSTL